MKSWLQTKCCLSLLSAVSVCVLLWWVFVTHTWKLLSLHCGALWEELTRCLKRLIPTTCFCISPHFSKPCKVLSCCEMFVWWLQLVFFPTPWHIVSVFYLSQVLLKSSCCCLLGGSHMPHAECFLWAVFELKTPGPGDCEFLIVLQSSEYN